MNIVLTVLLVLLALLVGLWFLRVGGRIVYSQSGLLLQAKVGVLYFTLYPGRKKRKRRSDKKKQPSGEADRKPEAGESKLRKLMRKAGVLARKSERFLEQETGGDLRLLLNTLPELFQLLGEGIRKLRVEELYLNYTIAGRYDPAGAAIRYGSICATGGAVSGILRQKMDIRRQRTQAAVDFTAEESRVYVRLTLSYTIGQLVVIGVHAIRYFLQLKESGTKDNVEVNSNRR